MNFKTYHVEFNRIIGDNIRRAAKKFNKTGLLAQVGPHKTYMKIEKPGNISWGQFLQILKKFMQPKVGSILLFSCSTGKAFICSNKGNRRGLFIEQ